MIEWHSTSAQARGPRRGSPAGVVLQLALQKNKLGHYERAAYQATLIICDHRSRRHRKPRVHEAREQTPEPLRCVPESRAKKVFQHLSEVNMTSCSWFLVPGSWFLVLCTLYLVLCPVFLECAKLL